MGIGAGYRWNPREKEALATRLDVDLTTQIPEGVVCTRASGACTTFKVKNDVQMGAVAFAAAWAEVVAHSVLVLAVPLQRMLVKERLVTFFTLVTAIAALVPAILLSLLR
mmetsp:Transcript_37578/g.120795  ORF Transcript_37578/g.120795 Transcript_37578/m.120795 type:complete len:110 (+) Transcript_37578:568-897(+)|eukprot:scaffold28388_cov146-Isochrysis_galbana.AAC.1